MVDEIDDGIVTGVVNRPFINVVADSLFGAKLEGANGEPTATILSLCSTT